MSLAASIRMSESDSPVYGMTPIVSAISRARASSLRLFSDRSGPSMMLTARSIPNTLFFLSSGGIASPYLSLIVSEDAASHSLHMGAPAISDGGDAFRQL